MQATVWHRGQVDGRLGRRPIGARRPRSSALPRTAHWSVATGARASGFAGRVRPTLPSVCAAGAGLCDTGVVSVSASRLRTRTVTVGHTSTSSPHPVDGDAFEHGALAAVVYPHPLGPQAGPGPPQGRLAVCFTHWQDNGLSTKAQPQGVYGVPPPRPRRVDGTCVVCGVFFIKTSLRRDAHLLDNARILEVSGIPAEYGISTPRTRTRATMDAVAQHPVARRDAQVPAPTDDVGTLGAVRGRMGSAHRPCIQANRLRPLRLRDTSSRGPSSVRRA
jgi:hypothetical protein